MAIAISSRCIRHPNEFSISQGNTQIADEIESINQSIGLILSTSKGELFGDPTFGSRLKEYLYEYVSIDYSEELRDVISEELNDQEPRIILNRNMISISFEETTVTIHIKYELRYTDITSEFTYITQIQEGE